MDSGLPPGRWRVEVELEVEVPDVVALQAEALEQVPPRGLRVWSPLASLQHLLLWPLVRAAAKSRSVSVHAAKVAAIDPVPAGAAALPRERAST